MNAPRKAIAGFALALSLVASCPSIGLAWGPRTHQYINHLVDPDASHMFIFAGTYPDSAAMTDLGDFYHAPQLKAEAERFTGTPWAETTNFAAAWLESIRLQDLDPRTLVRQDVRDEARGWGGHIVADWVAHSRVPLTYSPGDLLTHGLFEYSTDILVRLAGYVPPEGFKMPYRPDTAKSIIMSQCANDWYSRPGNAGKDTSRLRLDWCERGLGYVTDPALIYEKCESWVKRQTELLVSQEVLIQTRPAVAVALAQQAEALGAVDLIARSRDEVEAWLEAPRPYHPPFFDDIVPLYPPWPPIENGESLTARESDGGCDACLYEAMGALAQDAIEAGLVSLTEEQSPDEPGVALLGIRVLDEATLACFVKDDLAVLSSSENRADLSPDAWRMATCIDRMVNHGISSFAALEDFAAPVIVPITPAPTGRVGLLRPPIVVSFDDPAPSAGIDPASVEVFLDGVQLAATLDESLKACTAELPFDLPQGYHTLSITVADMVGQSSTAEWTFSIALDLTWLPPVSAKRTAQITQTLPVIFTLRDANGSFVADPSLSVRVYDKSNPLCATLFRVSQPGGVRVNLKEEQYHLNMKVKDLSWAKPGTCLGISVEAGGIKLGEARVDIR